MTDLVPMPTESEWATMAKWANALAGSSIVPATYRGKPGDLMACAMTARELGIGPMAAMRYIVVIQGNADLNAQGKVAIVRRAGHSLTTLESSPSSVTVEGKRADTGDVERVTFTLEDAQRAGLKGANWNQYPEDMLWARAVSRLCRRLFGDVLAGMTYVEDELADFVPSEPHPRATEPVVVDAPAVLTPPVEDEQGEEGGEAAPPDATPSSEPPPPPSITDAQVKLIHVLLGKTDWSDSDYRDYLGAVFGVESSKELTQVQASELIERLREEAGEPEPVRERASALGVGAATLMVQAKKVAESLGVDAPRNTRDLVAGKAPDELLSALSEWLDTVREGGAA